MNSKLTLTIEKSTIRKAKKYAKLSGRSLSNLVESYLEKLTQAEISSLGVPEEFKELFGVIDLPPGMDDKSEIRSIVTKKHQS
jgi:hypothetical protein